MAASSPSTSERPFINYNNLITVLVGTDETPFQVHADVIAHSSDFFRKAGSGDFREAAEKIVRLPEMGVQTFTAYVHWSYTGTVKVNGDEDAANGLDFETSWPIAENLIELYVAGDMLSDMRLRNTTIDRFLEVCDSSNAIPGCNEVDQAYRSTPEGSTLSKLVVEFYFPFDNATWFKSRGQSLDEAFLIDVLYGKTLHVKAPAEYPTFKDRCKYHEHDEKIPKCAQD